MEEIRDMFLKLQADVNDTKKSLKDVEENITKNISNNIKEMVGNLQIKFQDLETNQESQERRLDNIERTQRQRYIVIFGLEEEKRGYNELALTIFDFFNEQMNMNCTESEIEAARRIGRKGEKTRPVIVTLTTLGRRIEILKKGRSLRNTKYSIAEDFPPKILEKRKSLFEQAQKEKEKGNKVIIRYDKLITLPPRTVEQNANETCHKKRLLTKSPPSSNQNNENENNRGTTQAQKKTKISSYWTSTPQPNQSGYDYAEAGPSGYCKNKQKEKNTDEQKQKQ